MGGDRKIQGQRGENRVHVGFWGTNHPAEPAGPAGSMVFSTRRRVTPRAVALQGIQETHIYSLLLANTKEDYM